MQQVFLGEPVVSAVPTVPQQFVLQPLGGKRAEGKICFQQMDSFNPFCSLCLKLSGSSSYRWATGICCFRLLNWRPWWAAGKKDWEGGTGEG